MLSGVGGLNICGLPVVNVATDDARSALEAMCISPRGDARLQLIRQLTAAGLNLAAGTSADFPDFAACNAVCANPEAPRSAVTACVDGADAFNNSGDSVGTPFDPPGPANSSPCDMASLTRCDLVSLDCFQP